jgi:hypothetical protein
VSGELLEAVVCLLSVVVSFTESFAQSFCTIFFEFSLNFTEDLRVCTSVARVLQFCTKCVWCVCVLGGYGLSRRHHETGADFYLS